MLQFIYHCKHCRSLYSSYDAITSITSKPWRVNTQCQDNFSDHSTYIYFQTISTKKILCLMSFILINYIFIFHRWASRMGLAMWCGSPRVTSYLCGLERITLESCPHSTRTLPRALSRWDSEGKEDMQVCRVTEKGVREENRGKKRRKERQNTVCME